jgi:hypothetical protein
MLLHTPETEEEKPIRNGTVFTSSRKSLVYSSSQMLRKLCFEVQYFEQNPFLNEFLNQNTPEQIFCLNHISQTLASALGHFVT